MIVTEGAPVLRATAKAVPKEMFGTPALFAVINQMKQELRETEHGIAIAAPQIGESWRIFVVRGFVLADIGRDHPDAERSVDRAFINPVIARRSQKKVMWKGEGCLSIPNVYGTIERSARVTVRAQDETGKKFERSGVDVLAEVFEHEIDHLEGVLFIDKATETHMGDSE